MKVPQEWIEEIVTGLKHHMNYFITFHINKDVPDSRYYEAIQEFLNTPFNNCWEIPHKLEDSFKDFFVSILTHQFNIGMHPLTCGVGGGSHDILVPRIHISGECYLICPTCGWIQKQHHVPGFRV